MEKFTPAEFSQYYSGAFLLDNTGMARAVGNYLGGDNFELLRKNEPVKAVSLKELDWSNMAFPRLGYVNLNQSGKRMYHVRRMVGRITAKGVSNNTIKIEPERHTINFMQYIGQSVDNYYADVKLTGDMADQIYHPWFPSLKMAVASVMTKADAVSYAVHHDVALVPGVKEKATLMLLWKGNLAAYSADGNKWFYYAKDYEDALKRCLRELQ